MLTLRDRFETAAKATEDKLLKEMQAYDKNIVRFHFQYGHPITILRELEKLGGNLANQYKRFPLIAVFEDLVPNELGPGLYSVKPKMIIARGTKKEYGRKTREDLNFIPVLWPIAQEFVLQLRKTGMFQYSYRKPPSMIERPFWGKEGLYGNTGNIFNSELDCIEISGADLIVRETTNKCGLIKNF